MLEMFLNQMLNLAAVLLPNTEKYAEITVFSSKHCKANPQLTFYSFQIQNIEVRKQKLVQNSSKTWVWKPRWSIHTCGLWHIKLNIHVVQ